MTAEEHVAPVVAKEEGDSAGSFEMSTRRAIGGAALVLALGNLSGSLLGFVRQAAISGAFGQTSQTDAFNTASIVPQMFYDLTIGAAVSAALIPMFTEVFERDGREALRRLVGSVFGLAWIVLAVVVLLLVLLARPFVSLLAAGLDPQHTSQVTGLTVQIVRILVPSLLFLGTSAILLSTLYSLRRFTVPAFAPSLYHLGIIAGALFLARPLGIMALPIGALVGAACQSSVQAFALARDGRFPRPHFVLTPELRRILTLYAPVAAGLLISVGGQIIDIHFKLALETGALSAMTQATTLTQFPIGIAVAALSFAVMPTLSSHAAFERGESFKETLAFGIRLVLFLTIPAAAGYVVLSTPIVALILQHGAFTRADTLRVGTALTGYAIQIPFVGVDQLLIFAFYARRNTVTPMLVGILGVVVYVSSALLLMPRLQILGLALANTLQNSCHALVLLILLLLTIGRFGDRAMLRSIGLSIGAAAVMSVVALGCTAALQGAGLSGGALVDRFLAAFVPIVVGAAAYIGLQVAAGSPELGLIVDVARTHVRPRGRK